MRVLKFGFTKSPGIGTLKSTMFRLTLAPSLENLALGPTVLAAFVRCTSG